MDSCRVYRGECSEQQLQRFLLLAMGVRFEEILEVNPQADRSSFYMPSRINWFGPRRGKWWHVASSGGSAWSAPIAIKGKVEEISTLDSERISRIDKVSGSGNELKVSRLGFVNTNFSVTVVQAERRNPSNWLWMWRAVGVDLTET